MQLHHRRADGAGGVQRVQRGLDEEGDADPRPVQLSGDGLEAIMAAAQFGLDNLTLVIDHNRFQQGAALADTINMAPLAQRLAAFGWAVEEVDGHDIAGLVAAFAPDAVMAGKPKCIIAHTNKGQGISFMQDRVDWHHKVPNAEQYQLALYELEPL